MIDGAHPLLLGSASPRRRALLLGIGLPLRVAAPEVDESFAAGEGDDAYLVRIAAAKLHAAMLLPEAHGAAAVLVADTAVVVDGRLLGKPLDQAEAAEMIRALSGRVHEVKTRFAIGVADGARQVHAETVITRGEFRELDPEEVADYAATGEGLDKAGAYAVQGIGGFAVRRIEGSYSNVVGLPVCEVVLALRRAGLLARFPLARGST